MYGYTERLNNKYNLIKLAEAESTLVRLVRLGQLGSIFLLCMSMSYYQTLLNSVDSGSLP